VRLVRVATINIKDLPEELRGWEAHVDEIVLRTLGVFPREANSILLVTAETSLPVSPEVNDQNQVVVPSEICRELETAIELIANALSITQRARRTVSSANPSVALIADNDDEREWLSARSSFAFPGQPGPFSSHVTAKCDVLQMLPNLMDRRDGMALLSEALSHVHGSGRFKEFVRFFERAFCAATTNLVNPLASFLAQTPYGYTSDEVRNWIIDVRHPLIHADRRSDFLVEADVRPLLARLEQAAYDVLLNKEIWRSTDSSRRWLWIPDAFNTPTGAVVRQHSTPTSHMQPFDELGVYPINLQANLTNPPDDWWYGFPAPSREELVVVRCSSEWEADLAAPRGGIGTTDQSRLTMRSS